MCGVLLGTMVPCLDSESDKCECNGDYIDSEYSQGNRNRPSIPCIQKAEIAPSVGAKRSRVIHPKNTTTATTLITASRAGTGFTASLDGRRFLRMCCVINPTAMTPPTMPPMTTSASWPPVMVPNVEVCGAAGVAADEARGLMPRPATPPC